MTRIFISYRTGDEHFAAVTLDNRLSARFGADNVFRDSRHVPPGVDFEPVLWRNVAGCSAVVAVVGPRWLTGNGSVNLLKRPKDFVRRELELALDLKIPVVPVLIGDAAMPDAADLPGTLTALVKAERRAVHPRNAETDVQRLVDEIHERYGDQPTTRSGTVAVIQSAAGSALDLLATLVRKATVDAGLPMALVETVVDAVQVVQPDAPRAVAMAGDFVQVLDDALRATSGIGGVRAALHYGQVTPTPEPALQLARQLVAEPDLQRALRETSGARMVLAVSSSFYQMVIKPGHRSIDKSKYLRVNTAAGDAWVRAPGFSAPRGFGQYKPQRATDTRPSVEIGTVAGDLVMRDKINLKIEYGTDS
jgi:hypothetical protein